MRITISVAVLVSGIFAFAVENGKAPSEAFFGPVARFHMQYPLGKEPPQLPRGKNDAHATASALGRYCMITSAHIPFENANAELQMVDERGRKAIIPVDTEHFLKANANAKSRDESAAKDVAIVRLKIRAPSFFVLESLRKEPLSDPNFSTTLTGMVKDAANPRALYNSEAVVKEFKDLLLKEAPALTIVGAGFSKDKEEKFKLDIVGRAEGTFHFLGDWGKVWNNERSGILFSYPRTAKHEPADSGAPIFMKIDETWHLVAIHKGAKPDDIMRHVAISDNFKWIEETYKSLKCDEEKL